MTATQSEAVLPNPSHNMSLKIYFCDGCNESIPLKDINANRIAIDAGKIYCAKCAPRKPREAARVSTGVVVALLLLVATLVGSAAFLMGRQLQAVETKLSGVDKDVTRLRADADAYRRESLSREDAATQRADLMESLGRVEKELAGATEKWNVLAATLRTEVAAVEQRVLESMKADRAAVAKELDALKKLGAEGTESMATLRAGLDQSDRRVSELAAKVAELAAMPKTAPATPESAPVTETDMTAEKEQRDLIGKLKDPEAAERYKAVIELGRLKGDTVISALEAAVADPESYVRDAVVRQLRKLGSHSSIPILLKSLRDEDYFVRASAREALKALTSADVAFDPGASAPEREARAKEWDAWWASNKDKLLKPK